MENHLTVYKLEYIAKSLWIIKAFFNPLLLSLGYLKSKKKIGYGQNNFFNDFSLTAYFQGIWGEIHIVCIANTTEQFIIQGFILYFWIFCPERVMRSTHPLPWYWNPTTGLKGNMGGMHMNTLSNGQTLQQSVSANTWTRFGT